MPREYCSSPVSVTLKGGPRLGVTLGSITPGAVPVYSGEYKVTPSGEAYTLPTAGKRLENDIVVDAIPENYGLITWNGSYIRVS